MLLEAIFDCICGKRLVVVLRTILPILEKFGEIDLSEEVAQKLQCISAVTIDRLLAKEKKKTRRACLRAQERSICPA